MPRRSGGLSIGLARPLLAWRALDRGRRRAPPRHHEQHGPSVCVALPESSILGWATVVDGGKARATRLAGRLGGARGRQL